MGEHLTGIQQIKKNVVRTWTNEFSDGPGLNLKMCKLTKFTGGFL